MRQRFINVHYLRAKVFKLKTLLLPEGLTRQARGHLDRKSTRLNSSHV